MQKKNYQVNRKIFFLIFTSKTEIIYDKTKLQSNQKIFFGYLHLEAAKRLYKISKYFKKYLFKINLFFFCVVNQNIIDSSSSDSQIRLEKFKLNYI